MPLPEEVINRLSEDRPAAPEHSYGLLMFSFGILAIVILLYIAMVFGYEPYLNGEVSSANAAIAQASQSVSSAQADSFISFYSQIVHMKSLLENHVFFSHVLAWLEADTEANVYYQSLSFVSGNQVSLSVLAKSEDDMNQQIAIFESDPNVQNVSVSNVSIANMSGYWQSSITLTISPALLLGAGVQ